MTNDRWSKAWPKTTDNLWFKSAIEWPSGTVADKILNESPVEFPSKLQGGWDLAKPESDKTVIWPKGSQLKSQGSNLVDDQAYLYFQCESCQDILDPHTRSFKTLQEHRFNAGWKVVWNTNGLGYKVYCKKCGEA